ncbi:copper transporter [Natroniella sulfidigena]|uniref:copper transporter n=1 Tax=Natroniella sulfidigena TaxID=723921 RepID=UPI00200B7DA4|nr:copper transporter [Natroniella sulfidigena]MCK8817533.1 copper transporter [Natroniella sulfidigena]
MLLDLRYHIITIVIIFITLAIGILIGSTMVGNESIVQEQNNLISKLEEEFLSIRTKNQKFKQEVESLEDKLDNNLEFQEMILPLVVQGQLEGERILVAGTNNLSQKMEEKLIQTLQLADIKQVEILQNEIDQSIDFDSILYLDRELKEEFDLAEFNGKQVLVDSRDLESVSDLIKMVFQISSKELESLRGVNFE